MSSLPVSIFRHRSETPFTYSDLMKHQEACLARVLAGETGAVLIAEVAPVITLGKHSATGDLFFPEGMYRERGIELLRVARGGKATYHGPGQLVVFVVDLLERLTGDTKGVRKATCLLLNAAKEVSDRYAPSEIRVDEEVGVWSRENVREKFASLGIQIRDRVLQHGVCINGYATPDSFYGMDPCGIRGAKAGWLLPSSQSRAFDRLVEETASVFSNLRPSPKAL